jgi:hypothetical protein
VRFTIPGELTDLNTYINAERGNKFQAAKIKKRNTELVCLLTKNLQTVEAKVKIIFTWITKDEKKDPDNIAFAKKFILDGLVESGVLGNDGRKQIAGFEDKFDVDKQKPRIEIELQEVR